MGQESMIFWVGKTQEKCTVEKKNCQMFFPLQNQVTFLSQIFGEKTCDSHFFLFRSVRCFFSFPCYIQYSMSFQLWLGGGLVVHYFCALAAHHIVCPFFTEWCSVFVCYPFGRCLVPFIYIFEEILSWL